VKSPHSPRRSDCARPLDAPIRRTRASTRKEIVQSYYRALAVPDCEAKRCVDRRNERWQRVRIEFEFYSSNFRDHGHDPDGCDVIVCWEHDWADCPLEIVELRRVIDDLEG
jgi:hypothetical protein